MATVDANGKTVNVNNGERYGYKGYLTGPGQLMVIDGAGGGTVVLGDSTGDTNSYSGGTRVLSGTLESFNNQALPSVGVLTVAGPGSIVLNSHVGTLFGSSTVGQAVVLESTGVDIATGIPAADASGSPVPALATGVGMIPSAENGPTPVPEPSTLALLGAGLLSLLTVAWRRRKAG